MALVHGWIGPTQLTVQANAGDSRSVLGIKGRAKPLSFDHKPQNEGTKAASDASPAHG